MLFIVKPLLDDRLWELIEPLLPPPKPRRFKNPGRKPLHHGQVLTGILFVLKTGIPWESLPPEMGMRFGMSCWRRLHEWQRTGVWQRIHETLLTKLQKAEQIDWLRAVVDSSSIRLFSGEKTGIKPTDRRKAGSKHHVISDGQGIPLAVTLTGV